MDKQRINDLLAFYKEANSHPRSLYFIQEKALMVDRRVWRPAVGITETLLHYINNNPKLTAKKYVIDCGCGCGVLGLAAAFNGASEVTLTDIDTRAAENADRNIQNFDLLERVSAIEGDLLEYVAHSADVIFFNHLLLNKEECPLDFKNDWIGNSLFDSGEMINAFFFQALSYLNRNGIILMPVLEGVSNVSELVSAASCRGLSAKTVYQENAVEGCVKIYQFSK